MPEVNPFAEVNPFVKRDTRPRRHGKLVFGPNSPMNTPRPPSPEQDHDWQRNKRHRIYLQDNPPLPEWKQVENQQKKDIARVGDLNKRIAEEGGEGYGGVPTPDYINPGAPQIDTSLFSEKQRREYESMLKDAERRDRRRKYAYLNPQGMVVHPTARYKPDGIFASK
tara:strand:- start:1629 stop:2129 length:501 start_codon:yes stop_codon:yes gene_type:complete